MKRHQNVTDRAKRYRAQKNKPNGPKRCNFCVSRKNVDVDHIEGDEDDDSPENLMYLCRPCNTRKGIVQARNRIGRRTEQYNPESVKERAARSLKDWKAASEIVLGFTPGSVQLATHMLRNTPPDRRKKFADQMDARNPYKSAAQRRQFHAMLERGEISPAIVAKWDRESEGLQMNPNAPAPTYAQYAHGVSIHRRGARDEGGAIIHATPPALRHKYAEQIARTKKQRGTAGRSEVPF